MSYKKNLKKKQYDIDTVEGLSAFLKSRGYEKEAEKIKEPPKLSMFERFGRFVSAFETGNATYQTRYNDKSFAKTYATDILKGIGSGITGKDFRKDAPKKTYKDIMMKEGASDRPGKIDTVDVSGLGGDVFLDPSTYVGGILLKPLKYGLKGGYSIVKKLPIAGKTVQGIEDVLGKMFDVSSKYKGKMAEEAIPGWVDFTNRVARKQRADVDQWTELVSDFKKQVGSKKSESEIAKKASFYKEGSIDTTGNPLADRAIDELAKIQDVFLDEKNKRGFDLPKVSNFVHRTVTPEFLEKVKSNRINPESAIGRIRATAIGSKKGRRGNYILQEVNEKGEKVGKEFNANVLNTRKFKFLEEKTPKQIASGIDLVSKDGKQKYKIMDTTIKKINEMARKDPKIGVNIFKEDYLESALANGIESIKDISRYDFIKQAGTDFGSKVDDSVIKTLKEAEGLPGASKQIFDIDGVPHVLPEESIRKIIGDNTLIPQGVYEDLNKAGKTLVSDDGIKDFLGFVDKFNNAFKYLVYSWYPASHTTNVIGGIFQNFLGGVNPAILADVQKILPAKEAISKMTKAQLARIVRVGEKEMSVGDWHKILGEYGMRGQTGIIDTPEALRKQLYSGIGSKVKNLPQQVMGTIEDRLRASMFLDAVKKGKSFEEASRKVMKYHFDYMPEGFTEFEKQYMKKIIPFYSFTRNVIPLYLQEILNQPGKISTIFKTQRASGMGVQGEERSQLPAWIRNKTSLKLPGGGYLSNFRLPIEEVAEKLDDPLRGIGMSLSPFFKVPIEMMTGKNIFRDMEIDKDTYGKYYRNMPQPIKKALDLKEHTAKSGNKYWTVNPRKKYWLETIGQRGWNTAVRLYNGLAEKDQADLWSLLVPIKKYEYSDEDIKAWIEKERTEPFIDEMLRSGELGRFENIYQK